MCIEVIIVKEYTEDLFIFFRCIIADIPGIKVTAIGFCCRTEAVANTLTIRKFQKTVGVIFQYSFYMGKTSREPVQMRVLNHAERPDHIKDIVQEGKVLKIRHQGIPVFTVGLQNITGRFAKLETDINAYRN